MQFNLEMISVMDVEFSKIKSILRERNIFFSASGEDRFKDGDILRFSNDFQAESYSAFMNGNLICSIGSFSYTASPFPVDAIIGRYSSIAGGVSVMGARHPMERISTSSFTYDSNSIVFRKHAEDFSSKFSTIRNPGYGNVRSVIIGNDVWIGSAVRIKPGITIGHGSVIAANSVVTKDVIPYSVVGGNPAKFIKNRFDAGVVNQLLLSGWWNYRYSDFEGMDVCNPLKFIEQLNRKISDGLISIYVPERITAELLMQNAAKSIADA